MLLTLFYLLSCSNLVRVSQVLSILPYIVWAGEHILSLAHREG